LAGTATHNAGGQREQHGSFDRDPGGGTVDMKRSVAWRTDADLLDRED
jgi:hypothetical protein